MSEHEHRESHVEETEPDALVTASIGIIGTILLVIIVVFVQGLYERMAAAEFKTKVVLQTPEELHALQVAQLEKFQVRWVDKEHGYVAIPIERAMHLLIEDPQAAAPIIVPIPPTPPAPPAGAAPASGAVPAPVQAPAK